MFYYFHKFSLTRQENPKHLRIWWQPQWLGSIDACEHEDSGRAPKSHQNGRWFGDKTWQNRRKHDTAAKLKSQRCSLATDTHQLEHPCTCICLRNYLDTLPMLSGSALHYLPKRWSSFSKRSKELVICAKILAAEGLPGLPGLPKKLGIWSLFWKLGKRLWSRPKRCI